MGWFKNIAFAQRSSSQVSLRVWVGLVVGISGPEISGQWSRTGTDIVPCLSPCNGIWSPAGTPRRQNPS